MTQIFELYNQFINIFPKVMQWAVSVFLAILLVYAIYKILKKNFIYIILLVVLLPASFPIFKNIWQNLLILLKFLLTKK
jgi:hypothetical protein